MQHLVQGKSISKQLYYFSNITNLFMCVFDTILPIVYATTNAVYLKRYRMEDIDPPTALVKWARFSGYTKGTLLIVSCAFLADSIRRIRQVLSQVKMVKHMNGKMMIVHLISLAVYCVSVILFYCSDILLIQQWCNLKIRVWNLRLWTTSSIFSFISQLILCYCFWNLGRESLAKSNEDSQRQNIKQEQNLLNDRIVMGQPFEGDTTSSK